MQQVKQEGSRGEEVTMQEPFYLLHSSSSQLLQMFLVF